MELPVPTNVLATHKCTFTPAALLGLERATVTFASVRLHITAVVQATLPIPVNYETNYQLMVLLRRRRVFFQRQQVANGWCRDFYEVPQRWIYLLFWLVNGFDDDTNWAMRDVSWSGCLNLILGL